MSKDKEEWLIWQHNELSKQIDREFELLGQRTNWLVTGNAFLFTASAISAGGIQYSPSNLPLLLVVAASILGLIICWLSFSTMSVARTVVVAWKRNRGNVEANLRSISGADFSLTVGADEYTAVIGDRTYIILPVAIGLAWLVLLAQVLWFGLPSPAA